MNSDEISPDRSINIFHCLMEMNDHSVHQEIQEFLKSENRSQKKLSEIHCSALAYMLQMSEEVLDEFGPEESDFRSEDECLCGGRGGQIRVCRIQLSVSGRVTGPNIFFLQSSVMNLDHQTSKMRSTAGSESLKERKRSHDEEQPSCCASCQDILKDPVSTSCGHWFCRQCISSYWDQSASSGDSSCPQCGKRSRTRAGLQTASQTSSVQTDVGLQEVLDKHKISLRRRCERVTEGSDETGSETLLNRIYTELYITEGQSEEVNTPNMR
ncbi:hypothetical protein L3Q82_004765 [Scortum barcoo]|uniref:Uncharacterized protein n=1 Tax=Scortum barcoo TaxID=214431 RepID=A0ACB8VHG8_9TELE|nr:hypothetical protein L3Q82_004765 [Scortum barcoo]